MEIYLFTQNTRYLEYWKTSLRNFLVMKLTGIDRLTENDILIIDYYFYITGVNTKAKMLVLDNEPSFEKCMQLFKEGVKGYGNVYMHSSHIISAIESLKENKIWMYPDFITNIIASGIKITENMLENKIDALTAREKEITKLIMDGLTNKEIAVKLSISTNTIKVHTKNIYHKLNVTDRLSLFAYLK